MRTGWSSSTIALSGIFTLACGGATRSDLVAGDPSPVTRPPLGSADSGAADARVADPGGDPGGDPSEDAGGAPGGGSPEDAGTREDATTPIDGGAALDAGRFDAGRQDGGGVVIDAGSVSRVRCGELTTSLACSGPSQVCCGTEASGGRASYACEAPSECTDGVPIRCASNADCTGGAVCCGFFRGTSWQRVECTTNCNGSGGSIARRMCVPGTINACSFGTPCTPSVRLPGYGYCGT